MAGQLLKMLKTGEAKPASHEARLGIMVITILVFAFGFLVYHKMDMRQRQLTAAAIEPNAAAPKTATTLPTESVTELLTLTQQTSATDPLINIDELSDGSPFANDEFSLTEPVAEPIAENQADNESFEAPAEKVASSSDQTQQTAETPEPLFALGKPAEPELTSEPEVTISDSTAAAAPDFETPAAESPAEVLEISTPAFAAIDNKATASGGGETLPSPDELIGKIQSFPAEPEFEIVKQVESAANNSDLQPDLADIGIEFVADEPSFPAMLPGLEATQADQEATSPINEETAAEPILLALAEPQQPDGFDNGFLVEEGTPVTKAPVDDLTEFPASESETQATIQPKVTAEHKPHAGSEGFNAVANPGKRSNRNSIRTAAGSGSDGEFSLAAFNYGNSVAPAAPDDGSTFKSVVVQNGDNYTKISKRVYGTMRYFSALAVFNQHRIPEPKNMRPRMVVLVPAKEVLEERYPELFADSQPKVVEPAGFLLLDDGSPAYRAGERETISEISQRFLGRSSRWIEIYRLNQSTLGDPNKLKPGTILALPADAVEVNVVP